MSRWRVQVFVENSLELMPTVTPPGHVAVNTEVTVTCPEGQSSLPGLSVVFQVALAPLARAVFSELG